MKIQPIITLLTLSLLPLTLSADTRKGNHRDIKRPASWEGLVDGGRFMDRFESLPILNKRTSDTWGVDAVKPRDITLGIEDPKWSYWGGNILQSSDGKFHHFICRWSEDHPKGHMAWFGSEVVHAVSDNRFGPFIAKEVLGKGHNPEAYQLADGRYVCYVINSYYIADSINGPWKKKQFKFDSRDRRIIDGLSNLSFVRRSDDSFIMVCRGGGIWASKDGLSPWEQITQDRTYPKVRGNFEDPVMWRTDVQYHMIVNDWHGRIAYHMRSKDGVQWKVDSGEAYVPGIAVYADGQKEDWYKYERLRVFQDKHGRAIQANFAVIDFAKRQDKPNDIHSSKNIPIPLTVGRLLTVLNQTKPDANTKELRVRITSEKGFDAQKDVDFKSLQFGAPEEVDFGRGATLLKTENDGKDLIAIFSTKGNGFKDHNFAGKLIGKTSQGKLLFGYSRLPWVTYGEPILSARNPKLVNDHGKLLLQVEVSNYGITASKKSTIQVTITSEDRTIATTIQKDIAPLAPGEKRLVSLDAPKMLKAGKKYLYTVTTGTETGHPLVYKTYTPEKKKKK